MEPTEFKEFTETVEKAGEVGMRHVSLAISILAVAVALVTVLGHRAHCGSCPSAQNRASDVWSEYQARRIRQTQVQVASDLLQLQASGAPSAAQARLLGTVQTAG